MNEKYLIMNAGSSSLKFSLYDMPERKEIVNGYVEKIGNQDSFYTLKFNNQKAKTEAPIHNHTDAVNIMIKELLENNFIQELSEIKGIGHRIVHGAEYYSESVVIDDEVLNHIKDLSKLVPLHHPGEIAGVETIKNIIPGIPQIAVFDTAFHQTIPQENYMYAVPYSWYEKNGVRKYGFHGMSHNYITEKMKKHLQKEDVNLIICHLGSGASISCIKDGKCYDTSMGLTPLAGLVMGTRSGDIDPSIIEYMCREEKIDASEINKILNQQSGLQGIAGKNDFRDIENLANTGDKNAILAIKMLKNSIIKYIAEYYFELEGKVDALVFTAGIGENSCTLRESVISSISKPMNIELDKTANNNIAGFKEQQEGIISTPNSSIEVLVVPTDEESMILEDTYRLSQKENEKNYRKVKTR